GAAAGHSVTARTFEGGFKSTVIEGGPSQARERTYATQGWTLRETIGADGRALVSGVRARDVLLGNRAEWIDGVVNAAEGPTPPSIRPPVAGGTLSPALFARLMGDAARSPAWT